MSREEWTDDEWAEIEHKRTAEQLRTTHDPAVLLPVIREALALRCKLLRVVRTDAEPESFRVETSEGTVRLGASARWITRPGDFRAAFMLATGEVLARPRGADWDEVCSMIVRAAEVEDIGPEATDAGLGASWLEEFLTERLIIEAAAWEAGMPVGAIRHLDRLHVIASELRRWLHDRGERPSHARFGEVLRAAGLEPGRLDLVRDGERMQPRTWSGPASLPTYARRAQQG